jgi:hypothetical protein
MLRCWPRKHRAVANIQFRQRYPYELARRIVKSIDSLLLRASRITLGHSGKSAKS